MKETMKVVVLRVPGKFAVALGMITHSIGMDETDLVFDIFANLRDSANQGLIHPDG